jgi:hypothetical protein
LDSFFWKLDVIIGAKQMPGGLDAKRLEAMRPEGWEAILAHS